MDNSGTKSKIKVHRFHSANSAGGRAGNGHTATGFQASDYSKVHIGDRYYMTPGEGS